MWMHTINKSQLDKAGQASPVFRQIGESGSSDVLASMQLTYEGGRNDRVTVLDVFSWLPAKEISIEELEQIFIGHLNGTYKGNTRYCWKCRIMQIRTSLTVGQR